MQHPLDKARRMMEHCRRLVDRVACNRDLQNWKHGQNEALKDLHFAG
jgi:hypothetical protein